MRLRQSRNKITAQEAPCQVQKCLSPVGVISPPHLGQLWPFQIRKFCEPQFKQSLPAVEARLGATRARMPPTTIGCKVWQSGQLIVSICCCMKPTPSYTSASYPHLLHRYLTFQAIGKSFHIGAPLSGSHGAG